MSDINTLEKDMEIIRKLVNKEMAIDELSKEDAIRLIKLCQKENDNLDRRISEKEKHISKLEKQIEQYKKNENL